MPHVLLSVIFWEKKANYVLKIMTTHPLFLNCHRKIHQKVAWDSLQVDTPFEGHFFLQQPGQVRYNLPAGRWTLLYRNYLLPAAFSQQAPSRCDYWLPTSHWTIAGHPQPNLSSFNRPARKERRKKSIEKIKNKNQ